ncbi:MAG: hypothetical protein GF355_10050 [Candidatus Eisenbacteria bacterium]|nr:hypothetical protein [Candidatus Eisenbacteria bacterium]
MKNGCYRIEELGEILQLDPADPRRRHLQECAHCRVLLASIAEFNEPIRIPAGVDLADADRRLDGVLRREIGGEADRRAGRRRAAGAAGFWMRFWNRFQGPALKPAAIAAGAALAIVLVLIVVDFGEDRPHRVVPREEPLSPADRLGLLEPEILSDGRVRLAWEPVAGAQAYRVILYDIGLNQLAALNAGPDTRIVVDVGELGDGRSELLWQVAALRSGDELRRSRPAALSIP